MKFEQNPNIIDREKIYKKAKHHIKGNHVLCYALGAVLSGMEYDSQGENYKCGNEFIKNQFPEFALFEPYDNAYCWFENAHERKIVLDLCIAMVSEL